jgi:hypothetical protein
MLIQRKRWWNVRELVFLQKLLKATMHSLLWVSSAFVTGVENILVWFIRESQRGTCRHATMKHAIIYATHARVGHTPTLRRAMGRKVVATGRTSICIGIFVFLLVAKENVILEVKKRTC